MLIHWGDGQNLDGLSFITQGVYFIIKGSAQIGFSGLLVTTFGTYLDCLALSSDPFHD